MLNYTYNNLKLLLVILALYSCTQEEVPGGEITIKNDIMDKDYNSFVVNKVTTAEGPISFSATVKPGGKTVLPRKLVESFIVTRKYKDHSKIYEVTCPKQYKGKVTMKLIDIHLNKISGGCALTRKGIIQDGFTRWNK